MPCKKMLQANMQIAISMYSMWRCTPSNLTHLEPPGQVLLMPNCSLEPPEYEKKVSKINSFGLCENAWLPWQPILRFLRMWGGGGGGGGGTYKFNHILADTYHMLPN